MAHIAEQRIPRVTLDGRRPQVDQPAPGPTVGAFEPATLTEGRDSAGSMPLPATSATKELVLASFRGTYAVINGTYVPHAQGTHKGWPCWQHKDPSVLCVIFHTGRSRWVVSKHLDEGRSCFAFVPADPGAASPAACRGEWQYFDRNAQEWRKDRHIKCTEQAASPGPFDRLQGDMLKTMPLGESLQESRDILVFCADYYAWWYHCWAITCIVLILMVGMIAAAWPDGQAGVIRKGLLLGITMLVAVTVAALHICKFQAKMDVFGRCAKQVDGLMQHDAEGQSRHDGEQSLVSERSRPQLEQILAIADPLLSLHLVVCGRDYHHRSMTAAQHQPLRQEGTVASVPVQPGHGAAAAGPLPRVRTVAGRLPQNIGRLDLAPPPIEEVVTAAGTHHAAVQVSALPSASAAPTEPGQVAYGQFRVSVAATPGESLSTAAPLSASPMSPQVSPDEGSHAEWASAGRPGPAAMREDHVFLVGSQVVVGHPPREHVHALAGHNAVGTSIGQPASGDSWTDFTPPRPDDSRLRQAAILRSGARFPRQSGGDGTSTSCGAEPVVMNAPMLPSVAVQRETSPFANRHLTVTYPTAEEILAAALRPAQGSGTGAASVQP